MIAFRIGRPGIRLFDSKRIIFFIFLFLLVFPKGGFKIGNIPITWGYLLLGIVSLYALNRNEWEIRSPRIVAMLCLLPFQIISFLAFCINGHFNAPVFAFFVIFFIFPFIFYFLLSGKIEELNLVRFFNLFAAGIAFISYYGIVFFIHKHLTGKYFEIPLLTSNIGDVGSLDDFKCNSRGMVNKLISTYNNGQLFGISMSILLPLYCYVQKNRWHVWALKIALFLTLSRTTWIALLFNDFFFRLVVSKNRMRSFGKLLIAVSILGIGLCILNYFIGWGTGFFFDSNLGGRRVYLELLEHLSLFPGKKFDLPEIVYVGVVYSFGILGLIAYFLALAGPIFFYSSPSSPVRSCIILGLLNYMFISCSDGAVLYIPIMAFYWFFVSLLRRKDLSIHLEE